MGAVAVGVMAERRNWRLGTVLSLLACVVSCLLTVPSQARADVPRGAFTDSCVARAVSNPGMYPSLEAMNRACGLPSAPPATAPPSPAISSGSALTSRATLTAQAPCDSGWYDVIPADNYGLTPSVAGGLGSGHNIISYGLSCVDNRIWFYG